jgi:hypothetical protein
MSDNKLQLLNMANMFSTIGGLEQAIGDQKPEMIAFWAAKVIGAYQKCKADGTVDEMKALKEEILG